MRGKQKKSIVNIMLVVLAVLFGISTTVFGGIKPVLAAGADTVLTLNSKDNIDNVPFEVDNMFPGDSETDRYCVKVSYEDSVTVRFRVDVSESSVKLAEVLKCRVVLENTSETLYDGLMKNASEAMEYAISDSVDGEQELVYAISSYLDSSVGNEYQGQKLAADFVWWIEAAEPEETLPPENDDTTEGQETDEADDESYTGEDSTGAASTDTGDDSRLALWGVAVLCAAALIAIIVFKNQRDRQSGEPGSRVRRKVLMSVVAAIILTVGLAATTYALLYESIAVEANTFQTGIVDINLNDDEPVIEADEFIFEPGMTVVKDFFVENDGTIDVYYRLYFDNVEGAVAEVLEVTVKEGDTILYSGKAAEMTRENACLCKNALGVGKKVWLTAAFYYPETEDNNTQKQFMAFDICADAVQTKNNSEKLFE